MHMSQRLAAGAAAVVALLGSSARGEVVPDAVPSPEWVLGRVDASCQRVCSERSEMCDEDAFPKSQEEFVLIFGSVVNTVNDMCDSVVTGDACYEPSYKDGGQCGWKVCPEMEGPVEGDVSDSRCAAVPSSTSQRFCPCRRLDVWATLHMEKLHPDEVAGGATASPIDAATTTTTTVPLLHVVRKAERSPDAQASPRQARSVQPFLYLPDDALSEAQPEATLTSVTSTTTGTADQAILGVGRIQLRMLKDGKNATPASNATGSLNASVANLSNLDDLLNGSVANLSTLVPGGGLSDQDRNSSRNDSVENHSSKAHWFSWKNTSESNSTESNSSAKKLGSSTKKLRSSLKNSSAVANHSSTRNHSAAASLSHQKNHSAESHHSKASSKNNSAVANHSSTRNHSAAASLSHQKNHSAESHPSKDRPSESHSSKSHPSENGPSSGRSSDASDARATRRSADSRSGSPEADSKGAGADNNTAHGQISNSTSLHSSNTTVNTTAATTNASSSVNASTNTAISLGNTSNDGNLRSLMYPATAETTTTTTRPPVNGALVGGVVAGSVAATAGLLGGLLGGLLTTVTATTTTTLLITSTTLTSATSRPEEGAVHMAAERALSLGSMLAAGAANATGSQAQLGGVGAQLGGLGLWGAAAASAALATLVVAASVLAVRGRGSTTRSAMVEDGSEYEPSEMYDHEASPYTESPMQTLLSDQTMLYISPPKERSFQNSHQNSAEAQQRLDSMRPRGLNYLRGLFTNGWDSPMEIQGGRPPKAAPRTTYATVPATVTHVERWDLARIFSWFSRPPPPPPRSVAAVRTRPSPPRGSVGSVASATEPMGQPPTYWSPPRASHAWPASSRAPYAGPASPSSYARPASPGSFPRPASPSSWHAHPSRPQRSPPRSQRFSFNSAPSWQQSRVTMFNP